MPDSSVGGFSASEGLRGCFTIPALYRQYEGPFRVLEAGPKTFKFLLKDKEDYVSVDRLTPAYVDRESEVTSQTAAARDVHNPNTWRDCHVYSDLGQFHLPATRFPHVHVDLLGPLPPSRGIRGTSRGDLGDLLSAREGEMHS